MQCSLCLSLVHTHADVVRSLHLLITGMDVMVYLGLLVISLNCSISKVEVMARHKSFKNKNWVLGLDFPKSAQGQKYTPRLKYIQIFT